MASIRASIFALAIFPLTPLVTKENAQVEG